MYTDDQSNRSCCLHSEKIYDQYLEYIVLRLLLSLSLTILLLLLVLLLLLLPLNRQQHHKQRLHQQSLKNIQVQAFAIALAMAMALAILKCNRIWIVNQHLQHILRSFISLLCLDIFLNIYFICHQQSSRFILPSFSQSLSRPPPQPSSFSTLFFSPWMCCSTYL